MSDVRVDTPGGTPYGQGKALKDAQSLVPSVPQEMIGINDPQPNKSINSPSEDSAESLFAGAPFGPGPGVEALSSPTVEPPPDTEALKQFVPILEGIVEGRHASSARMRQMVRKYRSQLPSQ